MNTLKKKNNLQRLAIVFFMWCFTVSFGQDLSQIGKAKLFKLTGGISANSIFYDGSSNREPFTYFVNGNINVNISGIYNIPFSFSYSNQKFKGNNPFSFNRLSIHPSYKWVTTHIGDVSMTFSPYTLSGHQFTGFGFDLTPQKTGFKISAMYGRLLKESEYNEEDPQSQPAHKRIGFGIKASYGNDKFSLGGIVFRANDVKNSIKNPVPLEAELFPKENIVASVEGSIKVFNKGDVKVEYASSLITDNINADGAQATTSLLSGFITTNETTQKFKAYNANFSYQVGQGNVGVAYERIDPDYRTLGAYFFNNDLENITLNATQNLFNNKVSIAINGGLQKDDLDNTKSSQLQRVVSAFTVNYNASDKVIFSGGYSNFQSFTNIKNQFDLINEVSQPDNLDTLNFQQITQNANLNANFIIQDKKSKKENLNLAFSYQGAINKQNGKITENGDSNFYNANSSYTIGYPSMNLNISGSLNVSYSTIGSENSLTYGPVISANKHFFDKKFRTTGSISYNQTNVEGEKQGDVTNIRLGGNYTYQKRHNFSLNILSQFRNSTTTSNQDFTVTFGYKYIFDKFKPDIRFPKRHERDKESKKKSNTKKDRSKKQREVLLDFRYRDSLYSGTMSQIDIQLEALQGHPHFDFIPGYKKGELTMLRGIVSDQKDTKLYKGKAIEFLRELYSYEDFLKGYNQLIFSVLNELRKDMYRLDYAFESEFVKAKVAADNNELYELSEEERDKRGKSLQDEYTNQLDKRDKALARLIGHRWMLPIISSYRTIKSVENPDKLLSVIMELEKDNIFKMKDRDVSDLKIRLYMITRIIEFYLKESIKYTDPDKFELKYVNKL